MNDLSDMAPGVWLFGIDECVSCKMFSGDRVDLVAVSELHTPEQIDAVLADDDEAARTSGMWLLGYEPHYSESGGTIEWNLRGR